MQTRQHTNRILSNGTEQQLEWSCTFPNESGSNPYPPPPPSRNALHFQKTCEGMRCSHYGLSLGDYVCFSVHGDAVSHVLGFRYLGSVITPGWRSHTDVSKRLAAAPKARAFGQLYSTGFHNTYLFPRTKQMIYTCCVITVLLYGSECWTLLGADIAKLECFHNFCIRVTLNISRTRHSRQFEYITTVSLRLLG